MTGNRLPRGVEIASILVALIAPLSLVWLFDFFPTVDGSAHVHLVYALHEAIGGDDFYRAAVELSGDFKPNLAVQFLLFASMWVFPPLMAEKIVLTAFFVAFALAGRLALKAVGGSNLFLLPALQFTAFTFPLAFGFYNFTFSGVVLLAWFGATWQRRSEISAGRAILVHCSFALVACVTHVFALGAGLAILCGSRLVAVMVSEWPEAGPSYRGFRELARKAAGKLGPVILGAIPALLLAVVFLVRREGANVSSGDVAGRLFEWERVRDLAQASSLAAYNRAELVATTGFVLLLLGIFLFTLRAGAAWRRALPITAALAFLLASYLAVPSLFIVRWMPERIQPLVLTWFVVWLAALRSERGSSGRNARESTFAALAAILMLLATALRWGSVRDVNDTYRQIAEAAQIVPEHSTLLVLRLHPPVRGRPYEVRADPLIQIGSRLATIQRSIDVKNFQGQSVAHPVQLRRGVGATRALGASEDLLVADSRVNSAPPRVDLGAYERTGRRIDYILVWGHREWFDPALLAPLDRQLVRLYELEPRPGPRGLAALYRSREL